jgi:hypothetical protein
VSPIAASAGAVFDQVSSNTAEAHGDIATVGGYQLRFARVELMGGV